MERGRREFWVFIPNPKWSFGTRVVIVCCIMPLHSNITSKVIKAFALIFSIFLLSSFAFTKTVNITTDPNDETSSLELRNITLPDGTETTLYVVKASPITVEVDEDTIIANHIEFDLDNKVMRIVGEGTFISAKEEVTGHDFTVSLSDNTFETLDVAISTGEMDIKGVSAMRFPGQIDIMSGDFSPCSRCNQDVEDYGFKAETLRLYPGDRLVGFNVTVLIRGAGVMFLPVLVLPLGPKDKQPRLNIKAGKLNERAEVELDWPYVVGANAYGYSSLRYYADITPNKGNFFTNRFLGGRPNVSYLGGGVSHNFFTETGRGKFDLFYIPSFINYTISGEDRVPEGEKDKDELTFKFQYDTFDLVNLNPEDTEIHFLIERVDERQQRIGEYRLELLRKHLDKGIQMRFFSQGYIDLDNKDDVDTPSYAGFSVSDRTLAEFQVKPIAETLILGPLQFSGLRFELGLFESGSNPANRSVASNAVAQAARLLVGHNIRLTTPTPWSGFRLDFENNFTGKYYSSKNPEGNFDDFERLVDWNSRVTLEQRVTNIISLSLVAQRTRSEGETPFQFDTQGFRKSTDITGTFSLIPASWISLSVSESYVFEDDRDEELLGWGEIESTLNLFENLSWLSILVENEFNVKNNNPGKLTSTVNLNSPSRSLIAEANIEHIQDLDPKKNNDREEGSVRDESETDLNFALGYRLDSFSEPLFRIEVDTRYIYDPDPLNIDDDIEFEYWDPLEINFNINSPEWQGLNAFLRGHYDRDLNRGDPEELDATFGINYEPFEVSFRQVINYPTRAGEFTSLTSEFGFTWQNIARLAFETTGISLIPSDWLQVELPENRRDTYSLRLEDNDNSEFSWSVRYNTTYNPNLTTESGAEGGFEDTTFEVSVNTEPFYVSDINFYIADSHATLQLADDRFKRTFLQSAQLTFASDWFGVLGLQGDLNYSGGYDPEQDEFTRAKLTLKDVALTLRFFEQFYVSAVFNDTWDFRENGPELESPWNFQPVIYFTWDRCCWSFFSSWDTETGAISLGFKLGDSEKGVREEIGTSLVLPGRSITGNTGN